MEFSDEVQQCVDTMIMRHGRRAAQRFADLHLILGKPETSEFWATLASALRQILPIGKETPRPPPAASSTSGGGRE
jgi:hypothetical protein